MYWLFALGIVIGFCVGVFVAEFIDYLNGRGHLARRGRHHG